MNNMAMHDYRKLVEQMMQEVMLSDSNVPRSFTNSGTQHARVVVDVMLDNTQHALDVLSNEFSKEVWDASRVRKLCEKSEGANIRILVYNKGCLSSSGSALSDLGDLVSSGQINVRVARIPADVRISHIAVSDKQHVRVETNAEQRKALVSFGNESLSQSVCSLFEKLWAVASH